MQQVSVQQDTKTKQLVNTHEYPSASTPRLGQAKPLRQQKVLDEDEYVEALDNIIQRDYYPDLPHLTDKLAYLKAEENRDFRTMRLLEAKIRGLPEQPERESVTDDLTLSQFVATHTSEDNASFSELLQEQNAKKRQKMDELYRDARERDKRILLIGKAPDSDDVKGQVIGWEHKEKNLLMYEPEAVPFSSGEEKDRLYLTNRQIKKSNTRFEPDQQTKKPKTTVSFHDQSAQTSYAMLTGATLKKPNLEKIDLDEVRGLTNKPWESPRVGGFGFVGTPSPMPGVDASPIMTWGSVEGTPLLLSSASSPVVSSDPVGPLFNIEEPSEREQLAHKLTDTTKHKNQTKKKSVVQQKQTVLAQLSPSPLHKSARLDTSNTALRASYQSPSLKSMTSSLRTALASPKRIPTPKVVASPLMKQNSALSLSKPLPSVAATSTTSSSQPETQTSLTDDLLQL